jgi:hypothetical protein
MNIQPNRIECSNQKITHSVPVTTISGDDNVQGKFMYYKFIHKKLVFIYLNQILFSVLVATLAQDNTLK